MNILKAAWFSPPFWVLPERKKSGLGAEGSAGPDSIRRAGQQPRLGSALSWVPPFPKSQKEEGVAGRQSWSQKRLIEGFWVSVGFLFDCCLGGRAEPTGRGTAGTPALVRLPSSAQLPPAGECARPTVRGCGWGEGGAGSSEARAAARGGGAAGARGGTG